MPAAVIVREVPLSVEEAFARVTDWPKHGDHVPLTRIRLTDTGFVARTGSRRLGFDDPMDVTVWEPPHRARLEKRGRVVTGWATIEVEPCAVGARVTWTENAHVTGTPRFLAGLEKKASTVLFGRVLDRLLRT
ncbi:MAG: SRPBCC family protein [Aeromicrobium erythreum]